MQRFSTSKKAIRRRKLRKKGQAWGISSRQRRKTRSARCGEEGVAGEESGEAVGCWYDAGGCAGQGRRLGIRRPGRGPHGEEGKAEDDSGAADGRLVVSLRLKERRQAEVGQEDDVKAFLPLCKFTRAAKGTSAGGEA